MSEATFPEKMLYYSFSQLYTHINTKKYAHNSENLKLMYQRLQPAIL